MIRGALSPAIIPWRLPRPDVDSVDADYLAALQAIYAYSESPRTEAEQRLGRDRKLARMRTLLGLAGDPQSRFQTVLVAGTKASKHRQPSLFAFYGIPLPGPVPSPASKPRYPLAGPIRWT